MTSSSLALPRDALLRALWQQAQARVSDHWAVCPAVKAGEPCLKLEQLEMLELAAEDAMHGTGMGGRR